MPEENVEVVRRLIEMNRSGDLDAAAEAMEAVTHPDGEYPGFLQPTIARLSMRRSALRD